MRVVLDWQNELNVGDQVGVLNYRGLYDNHVKIAKVVKINGHGHITLDDGKQFDKRGNERNTSFSQYTLMLVDQAYDLIREQEIQKNRNGIVKEILDIVNGLKNSYGNTSAISVDDKDKLIMLVNSLDTYNK